MTKQTKIYTQENPAYGYKFNLNTGLFQAFELADIPDKNDEPYYRRQIMKGKHVDYRVFRTKGEDGTWKNSYTNFPHDAKQVYITNCSVMIWMPKRGKNAFESFRKACVKGLEEKLDKAEKHRSALAERIEKLLANKEWLEKVTLDKSKK